MLHTSEIHQSGDSPISRFSRTDVLVSSLLILAALALRLWHIDWSLPDLFEEATPYTKAVAMWQSGRSGFDLNPHFFNYPAFSFYLHFAIQLIWFSLGYLFQIYPDLHSFMGSTQTQIIVARLADVAFDLGTITIILLLAYRLNVRWAGWLAAGILALDPLQIRQAQMVNVDVPMTFFLALSVYRMVRYFESPSMKSALLVGISLGLATATKYTAACLFPVFLAVPLFGARGERTSGRSLRFRETLIAGVAALLIFFLFNPFILLDFSSFLKDFTFEQYHMAEGHLGLDPSRATPLFYLFDIFPSTFGWPLTFAMILSVIIVFFKKDGRYRIITMSTLVYLVVISVWKMRADRYLLPVIPLFALLCSSLLTDFWSGLQTWMMQRAEIFKRRTVQSAIAFVALLVLVQSMVANVISYHRSFDLPDTRTVARNWLIDHLPARSTIACGMFGLDFPANRYILARIPFTPTGSEVLAPFYDTRWYAGLDLLIASDYDYSRFAQDSSRYGKILRYYDSLQFSWQVVQEIHPRANQRGPSLWFYRYPRASDPVFPRDLFDELGRIENTRIVEDFAERLAFAHFSSGAYLKSLQLLDFSLSRNPGNIQLLREYTTTLYRLGKLPEALAVINRALSSQPDQPEMTGLRGGILLRMNQDDEAEKNLVRALAMSDSLSSAYEDLAILYERKNDFQKLNTVLRRYLLILPPGSPDAERIRGWLAAIPSSK